VFQQAVYLYTTDQHDNLLETADTKGAPGVIERTDPLEVYGPKGLVNMTEHIMAAYERDIRERIDGLEPANPEGYVIHPHEIDEGFVYSDEAIQVEAFRVNHGSLESFGYRFTLPDRVLVISGDTTISNNLIKYAQDCDVLIHEVYSALGLKERKREWRDYHSSVHTSTIELADIANKVRPKLLILYHQLFMGQSDDKLLEEITTLYDGLVISGKDLDEF